MNDKASKNGKPKSDQDRSASSDQDGSVVNKETHDLPAGDGSEPSPAEAARLLGQASQAADRVVTLHRFPCWWLVLYMLLPAAVQSLPLLLENQWTYVATVAGGLLGAYVLLTLMWPKLIRTGLGQDERLRLQFLFLLPLAVGGTSMANILWESKGDSPLLLAVIVFVVVAVVLGLYTQIVLHWYRVRVLARAFDFTESEEIWDSARAEIQRRIERVEAEEKARRRAHREERWRGQSGRARRQGNVPGGSLENE